jgi:hypothetical protein
MSQFTIGRECPCIDHGPRSPDARDERFVGVDETDGRFAEVRLIRCVRCTRLYLRYLVEYESFPGSGRWAAAPIGDADPARITPETAADFIAAAPWMVFGGSYFGHEGKRGRGPIHWRL